MKKLFFLLIILMTVFITSCNDDDENVATDYIIFGQYYGFCQGDDCLKYFKVDDEHVYEYEDSCIPIPVSSCIDTSPPELGNDEFLIAETLFDDFPEDLFDETETTLGCPDCADQGGIFLEIKRGSDDRRYWYIDNSQNALPTYLHAYTDKIKSVIDQID